MSEPATNQSENVEIVLRIPGRWSAPEELIRRLPRGFASCDEGLRLPDGSSVELNALPADDEFPSLFLDGCQYPPSKKDRETLENYTVNVCLSGPGGSFEAAARMLKAAAAIVRAGGAGVFIDNSGACHASAELLKLADDPDNTPGGDWGGVFWAYLTLNAGKQGIQSIGMHAFGFRDASMGTTGDRAIDSFIMTNFLAFTCLSGMEVEDGQILGGDGPDVLVGAPVLFRVRREDPQSPKHRRLGAPTTRIAPGHAMHNPYGQWLIEILAEG